MTALAYPLRPFLPADTMALREVFAAAIEELCQEDYDEDQRAAWASQAEDAAAFNRRLLEMTTLVVLVEGEHAGFASLKGKDEIAMLYVHPHHAGEGVGTALMDALEKLSEARGADTLLVESSETAVMFFEGRGYEAWRRNTVPIDGVWMTTTTMKKLLKAKPGTVLQ